MEGGAPGPAKASLPTDADKLNGAGSPASDPTDPVSANELRGARMAADLERIRQGIGKALPALYALAYFAGFAVLILVMIHRRLGA